VTIDGGQSWSSSTLYHVRITADGKNINRDYNGGALIDVTNGASLILGDGAGILTIDGHKGTIPSAGGPLISATNSNLTITGNVTLTNNIYASSPNLGGGVYFESTSLAYGFTMTGGEISHCEANQGGGVHLTGGTSSISGGEISDNFVSQYGGGIFVNEANLSLSGSVEIKQNEANQGDGAALLGNAILTMSGNAAIINNHLNRGIYFYYFSGTFTMQDNATLNGDEIFMFMDADRTVNISGTLGAASPIAVIKPNSPSPGQQVLSGDIAGNNGRFDVDPSSFTIDTDGKLQ
jgi:hypothetical protein